MTKRAQKIHVRVSVRVDPLSDGGRPHDDSRRVPLGKLAGPVEIQDLPQPGLPVRPGAEPAVPGPAQDTAQPQGRADVLVIDAGTNLGILALLVAFWALGGWSAIALVWFPSVATAAAIGVWLFYVQHQFEETSWDHEGDWDMHEAALHGASHYVMPAPLQWLSGNIGIHHIHHLFSRIPFYRLPEVLRDYPELSTMQVLTIPESLFCARRHLWDETSRRLLTFAEARALAS